MPPFPRILPHLAIALAIAMVALIAREWAYDTTYRLSLEERADVAAHSAATQRFDLENGRVVPQILVRDERLAFPTTIRRDAHVRAEIRPEGRVCTRSSPPMGLRSTSCAAARLNTRPKSPAGFRAAQAF